MPKAGVCNPDSFVRKKIVLAQRKGGDDEWLSSTGRWAAATRLQTPPVLDHVNAFASAIAVAVALSTIRSPLIMGVTTDRSRAARSVQATALGY